MKFLNYVQGMCISSCRAENHVVEALHAVPLWRFSGLERVLNTPLNGLLDKGIQRFSL
jgi:hypothetical protein